MDVSDPLVAVPLIVGLVEVYKRVGLPARWAPAVALGLGVIMGVSAPWREPGWAGGVWAFWYGVMVGLAAVGLYEVSGRAMARARRG